MASSRQRVVSYSSLSNEGREDMKVHYEDDYVDSEWGMPEDSGCLSSLPPLKQGSLYPNLHDSEDFVDGGYDSSEEYPSSLQHKETPDVNLKNVMAGIFAIITGQNKGVTDGQQFPPTSVSFMGKNGDTSLSSSVYIPSAPPLLKASGFDYSGYKEILEAEPPEWLPDSSAMVCMQCHDPFTAITRGRHHCRFCGGVFCRVCTKGRCLLPIKFRERNPQRVCDACYDRLDPLQAVLINSISNAVQVAKHDVLDWTCARGWLNLPVGLSMEHEIYKASITLRSYSQVSRLNPERSIPPAVLKGAKGLAILTVVKAGAVVAYKMGTGLVVARKMDGTWSAPSAIASVGLGWGAQIGGELTDFIIVLHNYKAVKTFCSRMHFSLGAGCSAAAGPVGRVLEADLRAGDRGSGLCYTYSCSKVSLLFWCSLMLFRLCSVMFDPILSLCGKGCSICSLELQGSQMEADDPTTSYMLQAWARLCKCLGQDFLPDMNVVMPPLLHSAQLKPDVTISNADSDVDIAESDDESIETITIEDKRIGIKTSVLEEKATACNMLCCYAERRFLSMDRPGFKRFQRVESEGSLLPSTTLVQFTVFFVELYLITVQ